MSIESQADFDGIQRVGRVVAETLRAMERETRAGITTGDLDAIGAAVLTHHGARSAPQLFYACPTTNLISVNDEIVHGLPGARRLRAGDVVKLDVTAVLDGYIADAATTVVVPPATVVAERLQRCAVAAFEGGCRAARAGAPVAHIGRAVERIVTSSGFSVIRALSGHGVGRAIHEEPTVPNFFDALQRARLTEGLVLTIEPIIAERRGAPGSGRTSSSRSAGAPRIVQEEDGWTLRTHNGSVAAHYEHTMIITKDMPLIVTRCEE
jgi:methionyl aminopeptidase